MEIITIRAFRRELKKIITPKFRELVINKLDALGAITVAYNECINGKSVEDALNSLVDESNRLINLK